MHNQLTFVFNFLGFKFFEDLCLFFETEWSVDFCKWTGIYVCNFFNPVTVVLAWKLLFEWP